MKGEQRTKKPLISEPAASRPKKTEQRIKKKQLERTEKGPAESENNFRILAESANDGILVATGRGNYVFANKRAAEITGYSIAELLKSNIQILTHHDEVRKVTERYKKRLLGESTPSQYETVIVRKDGKNVPIELTAARTTWESHPAGLAVIRDITERKRMEEEQKSSEERLRILFESAPDAYYLNDLEGNFIDGNKAAEDLIGYHKEELIGKNFLKLKLLPGHQIPKAAAALAKNALGKPTGPDEFILNRKDGKKVTLEISTFPVKIDGQALVLGIAHDITERKRNEKALRESEAKYHQLIDTSVDGVISVDSQLKITVWNQGAEKIFGHTEKEMLGQSLLKIVPEKYRKAKERGFAGFRKTGSGPVIGKTLELEGLRKDGTEVPVELSVSFRKVGKTYVATAIVRDITERKRAEEELRRYRDHLEEIVEERTAELVKLNEELQGEIAYRQGVEEALRKSEERSRTAFEHANDCVIQLDRDGKILNVNEKAAYLFGMSKEELTGNKFLQLGIFSAKDLPKMSDDFEDILTGQTPWITFRIRDKKGQEIYLECSASPLKIGPNISGVTLVGRDITERRRAEEALKTAEQEKAAILDSMSELVTYQDAEMVVLWSNKAAGKSVGLPPEQLIGRRCYQIWQQREEPCVGCPVLKALETGHPQEAEMTSPDGRVWLMRGYPVRDAEGEVAGAVEVTLEITDRRRAEEALRKEKEYYHSFVESLSEWVWEMDVNGIHTYSNPAVEKLLGYTVEEVTGSPTTKLWLDEEKKPKNLQYLKKTLRSGKGWRNFPGKFKHKNGSLVIMESTAVPIFDSENRLVGYRGIDRDITERKLAEEALAEKEEKYRRLVEDSIDGIAIVCKLKIKFVNRALLKMFGYQNEDEMLGRSFTDFVSPDYRDLMMERGYAREKGKQVLNRYEFKAMRKDGSEFDAEISVSRITYQGSVARQGIIRDISERKRAQEALLRHALVYRSIDEAVIISSRDGLTVDVNPAAERIFGWSREELVGKTAELLNPPEKAAEIMTAIFEGLQRDGTWCGELPLVTKSGENRTLYTTVSCLLDPSGKWIGNIGINHDITERKQAEEKLRESEERYRDLFENANDLIQCVTPDEKFLYVNRAWKKTLGYSEQEIAELSCFDIIHPHSQAYCQEVFQQVISGGKIDRIEAVFVTKDGREIIVEGSANCRFKDGEPFSTRDIFRDITERKRMEEELKGSFTKLKKTYEATVSALASSVEKRDPYTAGHQRRTTQLACAIAEEMGLSEEQIAGLRLAGLIHDIGKINVPAEILAKPSRLTETEFKFIKTHPTVGNEILKPIEFPWPVAKIVLQHHERLDGSGYPNGLAGEDMLLTARILAVADVVEAMSSHRPYRPAQSIDEALEEISRNRGSLYDPNAVEVCLKLFEKNGFQFPQEAEQS